VKAHTKLWTVLFIFSLLAVGFVAGTQVIPDQPGASSRHPCARFHKPKRHARCVRRHHRHPSSTTPPANPPAITTPTTTPSPRLDSIQAAHFGRVAFDGSTTATDAAQYQQINIGAGRGTLAAQIKAADPNTLVSTYTSLVIEYNNPLGTGLCAAYNRTKTYGGLPASDFLHTSNGLPLHTTGGGGTYWLDPSIPAVATLCEQKALADGAASYNAIFIDQVNVRVNFGGIPSCPSGSPGCANDTGTQNAWATFLGSFCSWAHTQNLKCLANIGGAYADATHAAQWARLGALADGATEESWAYGTNKLPVSQSQLNYELANGAWSEAHGKDLFANGFLPASNLADSTYGLATVLMVANGISSWDVSEGSYGSHEYWPSIYTTAQNLGAPLGAYTVSGSVYSRAFTNGTVTANVATHVGVIP